MLQAITVAIVLLHACRATEIVRSCSSSNASLPIEVKEGDTIRFTSAAYPNASSITGYATFLPPCYGTFVAPDGSNLQISFISGYYLFSLKGVENNGTSEEMDLELDTSLDAVLNRRTFYASETFTFEGLVVDEWTEKWAAFEAIVRSYKEALPSCSVNEKIDLSQYTGPVDFGTRWKEGKVEGASECVWTITCQPNLVMKLAVKQFQLRDGETLTVKSSSGTIKLNAANEAHTFPNEMKLTVTYQRKGGDSEQFGILLHASAYRQEALTSNDNCDQIATFDRSDDYLIIDNRRIVITEDQNNFVLTPYANFQKCSHGFAVAKNLEIRASALSLNFELGSDHLRFKAAKPIEINSLLKNNGFVIKPQPVGNSRYFVEWESDGDIAMGGYMLMLNAINCVCPVNNTLIVGHRRVFKTKSMGTCQNVACTKKVVSSKGHSVIIQLSGIVMEEAGDSLTVYDGNKIVFQRTGRTGPLDIFATPLFVASEVTIEEKRGGLVAEDLGVDFFWTMNARAWINQGVTESTELTDIAPASYRRLMDIAIWNVTSSAKIRAYILIDFLDDTDMDVYDGTEKDDTINITKIAGKGGFITSSKNQLTIKSRVALSELLRNSFIFVEQINSKTECGTTTSTILSEASTSFKMNGAANTMCYKTLLNGQFSFSLPGETNFIVLKDIDVKLGSNKDAIRIYAGAPQQNFANDALLISLDQNGTNGWNNPIAMQQKVVTIVLPAGSSISGSAYFTRGEIDASVASVPSKGLMTSVEYPLPNYRYYLDHIQSVTVNDNAKITIHVEGDIGEGKLRIEHPNINKTYESAIKETFSFTGNAKSRFVVKYSAPASGEKGYFLTYEVEKGGADPEDPGTESSPTTSSPISTQKVNTDSSASRRTATPLFVAQILLPVIARLYFN